MIGRWAVRLQEYNFDIVHRKTEKHGNADGLTRLHRPNKVAKGDEITPWKELELNGEPSRSYFSASGAPYRDLPTAESPGDGYHEGVGAIVGSATRSGRDDQQYRPSTSGVSYCAGGRPSRASSFRPASMNRHRLSTFTLPSDVPVFWQSAEDTSLSFTVKHLDVPILCALLWGPWWQWQAYVALSFCLLDVAFHWAEPADRTVESEVPNNEVELLLVQAWRTGTEGDFLGIIFGEVRDDNLSAITDELLVFLVQVLDDLPLEILSRCDERPGTATLTRSLESQLLWATCTELDEWNYYLASRGVYLTPDVTDLSTWDPLVRRVPEGQTSEEAKEEEEEEFEESTEEEERDDDPDYRESEAEVLGEAVSGEDNEEQEDDSEEETGEEEATSTDSSEAAKLTREEQEAEDRKWWEKVEGKRSIEDSGPPLQLLQGNHALNPEPPREEDDNCWYQKSCQGLVTPYWLNVEKGEDIEEGAYVWVRARRLAWKEGIARGGSPLLGRFLEVQATVFLDEGTWTEVWRGLVTRLDAHTGYLESARKVANDLVLTNYEEGTFKSWTEVSFAEPSEAPRASKVVHAGLPDFLAQSLKKDPEGRVVEVLQAALRSGVRTRGLFWLYTRCVDAGVPPRREVMIRGIPGTLWASIGPIEGAGEVVYITLPKASQGGPTKTVRREVSEIRQGKAFVRLSVSSEEGLVIGETKIFLSKEDLLEVVRNSKLGENPLLDARAVQGRLERLVEEVGPQERGRKIYQVTYEGWEEVPLFVNSDPVGVPRFILERVYPSEAVKRVVERRISILNQFRFTRSDLHSLLTWCLRNPYQDSWSSLEGLSYAFEGWGQHVRVSTVSWRYMGKICEAGLEGPKAAVRNKNRVRGRGARRKDRRATLAKEATSELVIGCMESVVEHGITQSPRTTDMGRTEEDTELGARLSKSVEGVTEGAEVVGRALKNTGAPLGERTMELRASPEERLHQEVEPRIPVRERVAETTRGFPIETRWSGRVDAEERVEWTQEFPRDKAGCWAPRRGEEGSLRRRDLGDDRPTEIGGGPRRWAERETGSGWVQEEAVGRNVGGFGDVWRGFRGQETMCWECEDPGESGRREEEPWGPPRARPWVEELDPAWYKPYDPAIDGPAEGPYFRRYDDRRGPYYDVNLGLESLYFNGRDVTGFVEK
ncbi:hypothetical protein CBR_g12271 [Chara braunii]|uniref:Uncharacterized protein n=1 Tax=Chara braunii TaxID=69332 RepID=A0A388KRM1_CHABU|nr:hypothetical protein CBR_g12271 [Chara braunii]|eukprot:GBG72704.1 hypothetical protein CBR_g12271 [Chara braunii]